jgi:hypothetical protein
MGMESGQLIVKASLNHKLDEPFGQVRAYIKRTPAIRRLAPKDGSGAL